MPIELIQHPADPAMNKLCSLLEEKAKSVDLNDSWPGEQLTACGEAGVFQWFLPVECGGQQWSEADRLRGYLRLSQACMTTTFILTQMTGACRRIAESENSNLQKWVPDFLAGRRWASLGISHLTTSRRHLGQAVLRAAPHGKGYVLNGYSPWVTGAAHVQVVVTGATLDDGRQILVALPTDLPGVATPTAAQLVGLTASRTGPLELVDVEVGREQIIDGPIENIMQRATGAQTGGLQTSALALGLASSAAAFLTAEAERRTDLRAPAAELEASCQEMIDQLILMAEGTEICSGEDLRIRANSLALRVSQASLAAAKGSGYVRGHPAGRWCREALFFLVWSCPKPVMTANLCELAGISDS